MSVVVEEMDAADRDWEKRRVWDLFSSQVVDEDRACPA
jgi:hypothetical protein